MSNTVDIKGLDKGALLAALYNASKPQGLGFIQYNTKPMSAEEGNELIKEDGHSFDYLNGRVMKINISDDQMSTGGYDRDNGQGAVATVVQNLRSGFTVVSQNNNLSELDALIASTEASKLEESTLTLGIDDELRAALIVAKARITSEGPKSGEDGPA